MKLRLKTYSAQNILQYKIYCVNSSKNWKIFWYNWVIMARESNEQIRNVGSNAMSVLPIGKIALMATLTAWDMSYCFKYVILPNINNMMKKAYTMANKLDEFDEGNVFCMNNGFQLLIDI